MHCKQWDKKRRLCPEITICVKDERKLLNELGRTQEIQEMLWLTTIGSDLQHVNSTTLHPVKPKKCFKEGVKWHNSSKSQWAAWATDWRKKAWFKLRWVIDVLRRLLEVSTASQCRTREEKTQEDRLKERLRATKCGRHYISILLMWWDEVRIH